MNVNELNSQSTHNYGVTTPQQLENQSENKIGMQDNYISGPQANMSAGKKEDGLRIGKSLLYTLSLVIFIFFIISFLLGSYLGFLKPEEKVNNETLTSEQKSNDEIKKSEDSSNVASMDAKTEEAISLDEDVKPTVKVEPTTQNTTNTTTSSETTEWERLILDDSTGIYIEYPGSWTPSLYSEVSLNSRTFQEQVFQVRLIKGSEKITFSLSFRPQTGTTPYCTDEYNLIPLVSKDAQENHPYEIDSKLEGFGYFESEPGNYSFVNTYDFGKEYCEDSPFEFEYGDNVFLIPAESISFSFQGEEDSITGDVKEIYDRNIYSRFAFGDKVITFEPGNIDKYYLMNIKYIEPQQ